MQWKGKSEIPSLDKNILSNAHVCFIYILFKEDFVWTWIITYMFIVLRQENTKIDDIVIKFIKYDRKQLLFMLLYFIVFWGVQIHFNETPTDQYLFERLSFCIDCNVYLKFST